MTKKYDVKPEQAQALEDLEKLIGKAIPQREKIELRETLGVKVEGDNVIGLGLCKQGLSTLPESIGNLKSLQTLTLGGMDTSTLSKSELFLRRTTTVKSERERFYTLPKSITKLESRNELILESNKLSTLPESITKLESLRTLNLSYNKLTTLPESIGHLTSLLYFFIDNNQLTILPESIGSFKSLMHLNLENNKLSTLPESIGNLESLQTLYLRYNKLTTLPESIGNLKSLMHLILSYNKLTTPPESIAKLESLRALNLSYNKLTTLPESIGNLKKLQTLDLRDNKLTTLPESFSYLQSLQKIDLSNNSWTGEWAEIAKLEIPMILKLCQKLHGMYIFISHAMKDEKKYHILELNKFLEKNVIVRKDDMEMNIIHDVLICEEDLIDDLWNFMTENVPRSHLLLFIATNNSIASEACRYELFLASKYEVEIIPIKGMNIKWENLRKINLIDRSGQYQGNLDLSSPKEKFEFSEVNFDKISERLSEYIKTHESELKKSKEKIEKEDIKKEFIDAISSRVFRNLMKDNLEGFKRTYQDLSTDKITIFEYYYKLGEILKEKEN